MHEAFGFSPARHLGPARQSKKSSLSIENIVMSSGVKAALSSVRPLFLRLLMAVLSSLTPLSSVLTPFKVFF